MKKGVAEYVALVAIIFIGLTGVRVSVRAMDVQAGIQSMIDLEEFTGALLCLAACYGEEIRQDKKSAQYRQCQQALYEAFAELQGKLKPTNPKGFGGLFAQYLIPPPENDLSDVARLLGVRRSLENGGVRSATCDLLIAALESPTVEAAIAGLRAEHARIREERDEA